tara:strand:+ start:2525 stop:4006 length:1482 start_codon:yes stop_codon:yes gene_type:complete
MSIFHDEETALTPKSDTSWSKGARTGPVENAAAAFKHFVYSEIFTSERNNLDEEYGNAVQILHEAGHTEMVNPLDEEFNWQTGGGRINAEGLPELKTRDELEGNFWSKVNELRQTDKNLDFKLNQAGLGTADDMQNTISKKAHSLYKEYKDLDERATWQGKAGGFGGIAAGAFTDPIMLATIPVSFGYSIPATFGKAALKMALMESLIVGVAETAIQTQVQPYRKELGFEDASLEMALKNIAMVTVAAGTLSPSMYGVFKAFGKGIAVGRKHLSKFKIEDLQKLHKEISTINPKFKNKAIEEAQLPPKDNPFENTITGRTEHKERLNAAVKSVNENTDLNLPPVRSKIDPVSTKPEKIKLNEMTTTIPGVKKVVKDLEKFKKNIPKAFEGNPPIDKMNTNPSKSGFLKKDTDLVDDINLVKDFDNPNQAVLKKQTDEFKDEFSKDLNKEFPVGVKINENTGEKTVVFKTGKQILDEELQDVNMINFIKKCAKL